MLFFSVLGVGRVSRSGRKRYNLPLPPTLPEVGDNVGCLGYFIFGYTTPTGLPILPIFHNAPFSDKIVVRLIGKIM
jgi:hypothetical protein